MKKFLALILALLMISASAISCSKMRENDLDQSESNSESNYDGTSDITGDNPSKDSDKAPGSDKNNNKNDTSDDDGDNNDDDEKVIKKKITFGSYPQSEVTNESLIATLNTKAGKLPTKSAPQKWKSFKHYHKYKENNEDKAERDFMWYIDIMEGDQKYRGVYFTAYRPTYVLRSSAATTSYQDDNGYLINTVYWFKYEPISWTVLEENSADGTSLILCDMIIDSGEFDYDSLNSKPTYDNNYSKSSVRTWLNSTFLTAAFNVTEQAKIQTSTVDNSIISTGHHVNPNACANTKDKIFLLSYAEAVNDKYGLELNEARIKKPTAYAKAQGIYTEKNGTSDWWLRSPAPDPLVFDKSNMTVRGVTSVGNVDSYITANQSYRGIVPALRVKL